MTSGPFRPAREISIHARREALRDPASYDPSPYGEAPPRSPSRWPLRLLASVLVVAATALVLLSWQLPAPWRYPVAAAACAGVWAFWQLVRPQRIVGRHRARAGGGRQEQIDELEAMLAPGTAVIEFGGLGQTASKTVGKH